MKDLAGLADGLSGGEREVLWCLFLCGAIWDGNIPSKEGRTGLIEKGFAYRDDGWTVMTVSGFQAALAANMHVKKGTKRV